MVMSAKKITSLITLDARRTIADFRIGWKQGKQVCQKSGSQNLVSDVFTCSKAVGKNLKAHNNLLNAPLCVAGALIPGGTVLLIPVAFKRALKSIIKRYL